MYQPIEYRQAQADADHAHVPMTLFRVQSPPITGYTHCRTQFWPLFRKWFPDELDMLCTIYPRNPNRNPEHEHERNPQP